MPLSIYNPDNQFVSSFSNSVEVQTNKERAERLQRYGHRLCNHKEYNGFNRVSPCFGSNRNQGKTLISKLEESLNNIPDIKCDTLHFHKSIIRNNRGLCAIRCLNDNYYIVEWPDNNIPLNNLNNNELLSVLELINNKGYYFDD